MKVILRFPDIKHIIAAVIYIKTILINIAVILDKIHFFLVPAYMINILLHSFSRICHVIYEINIAKPRYIKGISFSFLLLSIFSTPFIILK